MTTKIECPHCGKPIVIASPEPKRCCPHCGADSISRARGLRGEREIFTCAALCLLLFVPGILYYISRESIPWCSTCGRRVRA